MKNFISLILTIAHEVFWKVYWVYYFISKEIRMAVWSFLLNEIGVQVNIEKNCKMTYPRSVSIGSFVYINFNTIFISSPLSKIRVGNFVGIGPGCMFITSGHDYTDYRIPITLDTNDFHKPIIIEDDVWIGANVTILPGVKIKRGAVVAAGAIVTRNVDSYSIVGGIPAKFIKHRFSKGKQDYAKHYTKNKMQGIVDSQKKRFPAASDFLFDVLSSYPIAMRSMLQRRIYH